MRPDGTVLSTSVSKILEISTNKSSYLHVYNRAVAQRQNAIAEDIIPSYTAIHSSFRPVPFLFDPPSSHPRFNLQRIFM
jgi:hypothetical protein